MNLERTITSSVYVVHKNKVLLHKHKKYNTLFPLGGKMNKDEVPHQAAIREAYEESGLKVQLYNRDSELCMGRVIQLISPIHTLLENVGHDVENIDFIYFATVKDVKLNPQAGESNEFYWLSKEQIDDDESIKPHVKSMAIDALSILSEV